MPGKKTNLAHLNSNRLSSTEKHENLTNILLKKKGNMMSFSYNQSIYSLGSINFYTR